MRLLSARSLIRLINIQLILIGLAASGVVYSECALSLGFEIPSPPSE